MSKEKMFLHNLPPTEIEILEDTPVAGSTTIYKAYSIPSQEDNLLRRCVIKRTVISVSGGTTNIAHRWAFSNALHDDTLNFNKIWSSRTSLTYTVLNF